MKENLRILPLAGASNFRDLGGLPTTDGGTTHWGKLFRSDSLHEMTEADVSLLRQLGLRCVIDLRMEHEVERTGRGLLGAETITHVHLSVIDQDGGESRGIPAPLDDNLSNRYLWYLDIGRDALAQALTMVGDESNYPLVFHCAAGKDRTGVLAALVLDIIGVERAAIVEDYVLTAERIELVLERILRNAGEGKTIWDLPPQAMAVEAATMEGFLTGLDEHHGGARRWALAAGVPVACLDAMTSLLVSSVRVASEPQRNGGRR